MRPSAFSSLRRLAPLARAPPGAAWSARRCLVSRVEMASPPSADRDQFSELRERSLLRHIISSSTEGDPDSVMHAMDEFWDTYFNGEGTAEWKLRANALDQAIRTKNPMAAMEIGAYCGYTAVRIGRLMPEGGKLISIEIDPLFAAIATKVVEHAGLADKVTVEIGSLENRLPAVQRKGTIQGTLGAVLLDHAPSQYLPDLQILEREKLIAADTVVLCDWSLYPGSDNSEQAPVERDAFMSYLKDRGDAVTVKHQLRDKDVFTVSSWDFPAI